MNLGIISCCRFSTNLFSENGKVLFLNEENYFSSFNFGVFQLKFIWEIQKSKMADPRCPPFVNNDKITSLYGLQTNIFGRTIIKAQESCIALIVAVLCGVGGGGGDLLLPPDRINDNYRFVIFTVGSLQNDSNMPALTHQMIFV